MNDLTQSLELLALGMGGIFIVMFLLFIISQAILKITAPKKNTERDKV
jgi:Oxaloacetate decarboxylase, gamma chain.